MTQTLKNKTSKKNLSVKDEAAMPCIWKQAGVVLKKECNNYHDCTSCKYDTAMGKQALAGKHISWQEALRKRDSVERICRHALTGRVEHRTCAMNYNCFHCDFDQLFEDTLSPAKGNTGVHMKDIKGFKLADGYLFHMGHTWAGIDDGGVIRVGMDDFVFKVLGGPDGFELPLMGQELNLGRPGWGIKRRSNLADILSPVSGVITKVNPSLFASPALPEQKPYEDGWLFTVHNSDLKGAVKHLMGNEECVAWLNGEITILEGMIEEVAGPLSADGGLLMKDVFGNLPALGWENLTLRFLRS